MKKKKKITKNKTKYYFMANKRVHGASNMQPTEELF